MKLGEREWIAVKQNNTGPGEIGKRISALANGAKPEQKENGYLIYGIQDKPVKAVCTSFKGRQAKKGDEETINWFTRMLEPRPDFIVEELRRCLM